MTDKQTKAKEEQESPRKFIPIDEGVESSKKWIELNDELFRKLTSDERFDLGLKETIQNFRGTLKRLADGDGERPTDS